MADLKSGAIGAVSGAAMGGLMRGISDSNNGYDFWDGHGEAVDVTMPVGPNQANAQLTPQQIQNLNSPVHQDLLFTRTKSRIVRRDLQSRRNGV